MPKANSRGVADLAPDPRNPRRITDEAAAGLGESMRRFGDIATIVWNRTTGHLVAGHQRMAQLRAAGATTWTLDGDRGFIEHPATKERFMVRVVDWDETTECAANLAANNPSIGGEFTEDAIAQLEEIAAQGVDLGPLRLDALMDELREAFPVEPETGATDPDAVPDPPVEPVTRTGDLWLLGEHRLLAGDATKAEDVARVMDGKKADLCMTDPPYGADIQYATHDDSQDALKRLIAGFFPLARDVAEIVALTPGINNIFHYPKPSWLLCWFYGAGTGRSQWGFTAWQPIMVWGSCPKLSAGEGCHPDGFQFMMSRDDAAENKTLKHACPKPLSVWRRFMQRLSNTKTKRVYDPFGGAGTTLMACEQEKHSCCAIEIAPAYCDVAILRWQQFSGREATLDGDGRTFAEVTTERKRA